jgi:protein transport protein SEC24
LKENQFAFIQFAMLYATQFGERRIRVFNINLPVAKNLNEYFKKTDVEALSFYIIRKEVSKAMIKGAKVTRESIINNLVTLLHNYRTHCAATSSPSQLILPDSLKLLPLNILSALKTPALKLLPNTKVDDKVYWIFKILSMSLTHVPYFFYPRIYKVNDIIYTVSLFSLLIIYRTPMEFTKRTLNS